MISTSRFLPTDLKCVKVCQKKKGFTENLKVVSGMKVIFFFLLKTSFFTTYNSFNSKTPNAFYLEQD